MNTDFLNKFRFLTFIILLSINFSVLAQDAANNDFNTVIRKHDLEKSQVMDIPSWITDVYGSRLTGSPMLDKATEWAKNRGFSDPGIM